MITRHKKSTSSQIQPKKVVATYWEGKGKFQEAYEKIRKDFIPASGPADNQVANLVRAVSNLYYDWYNNGWGNIDNSAHGNGIYLLRKHSNSFKPYFKADGKDVRQVLTDIEYLHRMMKNAADEETYADPYREDDEEIAPIIIYEQAYDELQQRGEKLEPQLEKLVDAVIEYASKELYGDNL